MFAVNDRVCFKPQWCDENTTPDDIFIIREISPTSQCFLAPVNATNPRIELLACLHMLTPLEKGDNSHA